MSDLSPSYDNKIERKYSIKTLDQKSKNKTALQRELGWPAELKVPVICIPSPVEKKEYAMLKKLLPGLDSLNVQLLMLKSGCEEFQKEMTERAKEKKHRIALLADNDEYVRKMLAAADVALFLGDSKAEEALGNSLRYGTVPVCMPCETVENYNLVQESGNAFVYDEATEWHCFAGVVRALETWKFPYDWRTIQRHCMEKDKGEAQEESE